MSTRLALAPRPPTRSYPELLRARLRAATAGEPLLRNGHLLTLSSMLTAALGAVFWLLATSWYSTRDVGLGYAVLSAATLLAGIGQLNLNDVLIRFVPTAGRRTRRLLLRCYAAAALAAALAAFGFLALLPWVAPQLDFLREPLAAAGFVAATACYALFVLQDGALTGLRRPGWVLAENTLFSLVKTVLLALLAGWAVGNGILLSWAGALALSFAVTSGYLLRRAVPRHQLAAPSAPPVPGIVRYAAADYLGFLFRLAAYTVVPLMVLDELGAVLNAYFSIAWVIAYTLFLATHNMGSSLLVEAARDPAALAAQARRILRHSVRLIAVGVVALLALAPWLLRLFGPGYAEGATDLVRLLALAALPNLVLGVAIDVARARRRLRRVVALQAALCVLVLGFSAALLPVLGLTGVGLAWLAAESLLALPLLLTMKRWLSVGASS